MLCDDLGRGWDVAESLQREGTYVYLQPTDIVVQQKLTQHHKAVKLQLKRNRVGCL